MSAGHPDHQRLCGVTISVALPLLGLLVRLRPAVLGHHFLEHIVVGGLYQLPQPRSPRMSAWSSSSVRLTCMVVIATPCLVLRTLC